MRRYVLVAMTWTGLLLFGAVLSSGVNYLIGSPAEGPSSEIISGLCPKGWDLRKGFQVTGYYVPRESDFVGPTQDLTINGEVRRVSAAFLNEVDDYEGHIGEGWGQTRAGDYIGRYGPNGSWISSTQPLDAMEQDLKVGTIAVDPTTIAFGSRVMIPTLPEVHNIGPRTVFKATDKGDAINGRHIDIYTGVGADARQAMFALTSRGRSATVCIKHKK